MTISLPTPPRFSLPGRRAITVSLLIAGVVAAAGACSGGGQSNAGTGQSSTALTPVSPTPIGGCMLLLRPSLFSDGSGEASLNWSAGPADGWANEGTVSIYDQGGKVVDKVSNVEVGGGFGLPNLRTGAYSVVAVIAPNSVTNPNIQCTASFSVR